MTPTILPLHGGKAICTGISISLPLLLPLPLPLSLTLPFFHTNDVTVSVVFPVLNTGTHSHRMPNCGNLHLEHMNFKQIIITTFNSCVLFLNAFCCLSPWAVNICFSAIQTYYSVTNKNAILTLSRRKILNWECPKDKLEIKRAVKQYYVIAGTYKQVPLDMLGCELIINKWCPYGHAFIWLYIQDTLTITIKGVRTSHFLHQKHLSKRKYKSMWLQTAQYAASSHPTVQVLPLIFLLNCHSSFLTAGEINSPEAKSTVMLDCASCRAVAMRSPSPDRNCIEQQVGQIWSGNETTCAKMR